MRWLRFALFDFRVRPAARAWLSDGTYWGAVREQVLHAVFDNFMRGV